MTRRQAGFSLLELMVAVALAGFVLMMGLMQTSRATDAAQTRGLAEMIAEELRAARRQAIASQHPVAVGFPSGNGATAHSDGLYILEGTDKPHVTRGRRFSGDFPDAFAFVGTWAVTGAPVSRSPLPLLGNNAGFQLAQWDVPSPRDYLFVFTPSGHLVTNGLPRYDGRYHILASRGVAYTPASAPPGSSAFPVAYFQATQVAAPYTISLTSAGAVTVQAGVPRSSLSGGEDRVETATPPPIPAPGSGNAAPVLVRATADPLPLNLPSGVSAVIPAGGYLTLDIEVREPDGQVPFCSWEASDGTFSSALPTSMEWNPVDQVWRGRWVWTPPESCLPGQDFRLRYTVDDGHGQSITGQLGTTGKVRIGDSGMIAYSVVGDSSLEIGSVTPDGVSSHLLTPNDDQTACLLSAWQPGGNQLACFGLSETDCLLYVVNRDGSGLKLLESVPGDESMVWTSMPGAGPAWSPDGTRIAYSRDSGTGHCIWVVNADGSGKTRLTSPGPFREDHLPSWSPDGSSIIFERQRYGADEWLNRVEVGRVPSTGGSVEIVASEADEEFYFPQYTPDGTSIVYSRGLLEIHIMKADGTDSTKISNHSAFAIFSTRPLVSPDGRFVSYCSYQDNYSGGSFSKTGWLYVTTIDGRHPDTLAPGAKPILEWHVPDITSGDAAFEGPFITQEQAWSPDSSQLVYRDKDSLVTSNVLGTPQPRAIKSIGLAPGYLCPSWAP